MWLPTRALFRPAMRWHVLAVVVLTAFTWPVYEIRPAAGLDTSWQFALHLAARDHLRFGPGVVFTYGPLGYLAVPVLVAVRTYALSILFNGAVQAALVGTVYGRLRRVARWPVAAAATYLVARIYSDTPDRYLVVLLAWLLLALSGRLSDRAVRTLPAVAGAMGGLALLVKFNTGVATLAMAGAFALVVRRRDWRPAALAAGSAVVTFLAGWLLAGQRLGDLPVWFRRSVDVASGYSEAMALFRDSYGALLVVTGLVLLGVATLAFATVPGRRFAYAAVLAPAGWVLVKESVVRFHLGGLLMGTLVVLVVLPLRPGRTRWLAAATVALVAVGTVGSLRLTWSYWKEAGTPLVALGDDVPPLVSAGRRADLRHQSVRAITAEYRLTGNEAGLLAGHTVHVDAFDTSAVYALGVEWRPVPVFQAYSAYTPLLDEANAAALSAPDGPERILRHRTATIDGRYPIFESPEYVLAMVCHYEQMSSRGQWQVLGRVPSRCGSARSLGTVRVAAGDHVAVPRPRAASSLVYARLDLRRPVLDRLETTAFRPRREARIVLGGTEQHRLIAATAGQPLLLRLPRTERYGATTAEDLWLSPWLGPYTVRFYEVPLTTQR